MFDFVRQAAVAALVTGTILAGAHADDTVATPKIDAKANEVVKQMVEFYHTAPAMQSTMNLAMNMEMGEAKQNMDATMAFAAERPNKFELRLKDGMVGVTIVSDGTNLYTYIPMMAKYTKVDAPKDFNGLIETSGDVSNMTGAGEGKILLSLLADDGYDKIMKDVSELTYVGDEELDGTPTKHIKLMRDEIDMDIWVAAGDKPWIVKMVPDIAKAMAKASEGQDDSPYKNMKIDMSINFADWSKEQPADDAFAFAVPDGATKVDSLFEAEAPAAQVDLKGKPAPDFTLDQLDSESKFTLADHKGKDIVVIDFWATWCGPCKQGLPIIDEVTKAYADKGVVFYAIDLVQAENSKDDLAKTMKDKSWTFNVLLDNDSKVSGAYGVGPIPHSVIIDKDGNVAAVHIGIPRDLNELRTRLKKELDTLLAGGTLDEESDE